MSETCTFLKKLYQCFQIKNDDYSKSEPFIVFINEFCKSDVTKDKSYVGFVKG